MTWASVTNHRAILFLQRFSSHQSSNQTSPFLFFWSCFNCLCLDSDLHGEWKQLTQRDPLLPVHRMQPSAKIRCTTINNPIRSPIICGGKAGERRHLDNSTAKTILKISKTHKGNLLCTQAGKLASGNTIYYFICSHFPHYKYTKCIIYLICKYWFCIRKVFKWVVHPKLKSHYHLPLSHLGLWWHFLINVMWSLWRHQWW